MSSSIPTDDHLALAHALHITDNERILDIGGGHSPFASADVVVDIDFDVGMHRDGQEVTKSKPGQQFIKADAMALPFKDKSFDVVVSIHVLEHVADPALACRELMRVARRGFVETPRKWTEYYGGHPSHRWLVDNISGILTFEPILYDNSPFKNFALPVVWEDLVLQAKVLQGGRDITCVQFMWDNEFSFKILGVEPVPDDKIQARRYYNFATNLLKGMASPEKVEFHAKTALSLAPDNQLYRNFYVFVLALTGNIKEAKRRGGGGSLLIKAILCRVYWSLAQTIKAKYKAMLTTFSADES